MNKLKKILHEHKKIEFPKFPQNDNFSEWVGDLVEIDSYYVGQAITAINGGNISMNFEYFDNLKSSLNNYSSLKSDQSIFNQCLKYLESLEKIVIGINRIHKNNR